MNTSPIDVGPVSVLWANRKGQLTKRRAYQAYDADGEEIGSPQATATLARKWAVLPLVTIHDPRFPAMPHLAHLP